MVGNMQNMWMDLGLIMKAIDGDLTWQIQNSGVSVSLPNVYFMDSKAGWVTDAGGILLSTTDGGWNWSQQRLGNHKLASVRFLEEIGWVLTTSDPGLYYTADGGQTGKEISIRYSYQGAELHLDVVDMNHVWVGSELALGCTHLFA